ncbi:hypothetical protein BGZ50_007759, partial [Haplosporangium sp. Z 11]
MPSTSITEQHSYTSPSPVSTNPFRTGASVSPAPSIPSRNSELASDNPFSTPAASAINNLDTPNSVSESAQFGQTPATALTMDPEDPSDYPPPPAYTPTAASVDVAAAPP